MRAASKAMRPMTVIRERRPDVIIKYHTPTRAMRPANPRCSSEKKKKVRQRQDAEDKSDVS